MGSLCQSHLLELLELLEFDLLKARSSVDALFIELTRYSS